MSTRKPTAKAVKTEESKVVTEDVATEAKEAAAKDSGFCMYLGPTITGVIQNGRIYRGTRESVLQALGDTIEKYPLIKTLIVSGETLVEDRVKVNTPCNLLYINYQKMRTGKKL